MADGFDLRVVSMPMHDTGIGREAGFADDAALIEAAAAERDRLDPATRAMFDRLDRLVDEAFIYGRDEPRSTFGSPEDPAGQEDARTAPQGRLL